MKYSPVLQEISNNLYDLLKDYNNVPVKDYGWENQVWKSDYFRWAHLEKFFTPKVSVLHCVIMPVADNFAPIYGFDVIEMNDRLTGMFFDLTPVRTDYKCTIKIPEVMGEHRAIPQWADFFSDRFCCCIPTPNDLRMGVQILKDYLEILPQCQAPGQDYTEKHSQYIEGQKRNPQTYRMLKSHIGEDLTNEFIDNVLWPRIG